MKIAMHTDRLQKRFGAAGAVRMIAEAGFEAVDLSMYGTDNAYFEQSGRLLASEICRVAEGLGISVTSAHAPFSDFLPTAEADAHNREVFSSMCHAFKIASRAGAETVVVHPAFICPHLTRDERFELNMELYHHLNKVARDEGIRLLIENTYGRHRRKSDRLVKTVCSDTAELIRYADALCEFGIGLCFDVGHASLVGESAESMIRELSGRINLVHVHDNDFYTDSHTLPYLGETDFHAVCKALGRVGYTSDITMESDGFIRNMPDAIIPSALELTARVASHLRDEISRYSLTN